MCLACGVVKPATVCDHVEPHHNDPSGLILGELQSLCASCHSGRKQQIEKRGYDPFVGIDGWPIDPRHPANRA
jgi:hypothetical protein